MTLIVKDNGGGDFKTLPQGTHVAVCNLVADLGVQSGGRFKPRQKIYLRWEIPAERIQWEKDGKVHEGPAQIGKSYTASLSSKAKLRGDLENWRGRAFTAEELQGFDIFAILGIACQIVVTHSSSDPQHTYANVTGVMGLPKGMPRPKAERPLIKYSAGAPDQFNQLPAWLQEKIIESQAQATPGETVSAVSGEEADFDDDIPF